jgi:hypothetical protein
MNIPLWIMNEDWGYTGTGGFTGALPVTINGVRSWVTSPSTTAVRCVAANGRSSANSCQSSDVAGARQNAYNSANSDKNTVNPGDQTIWMFFQFVSKVSGSIASINGRITSAPYVTCYHAEFAINTGVTLFRRVTNVDFQLGGGVGTGATFGVGILYLGILTCVGSQITVEVQRQDNGQWLTAGGAWTGAATPSAPVYAINQTDGGITGFGYGGFAIQQAAAGDLIAIPGFFLGAVQPALSFPYSSYLMNAYNRFPNGLPIASATYTDQGYPWLTQSTLTTGAMLIDNRTVGGAPVATVYCSSASGGCWLCSDGVPPGHDIRIEADLVVLSNTNSQINLVARADPHKDEMYLARYNYNTGVPQLQLVSRQNGATILNVNVPCPTLTFGNTYHLVFTVVCVGTNLLTLTISGSDIATTSVTSSDTGIRHNGFWGLRAGAAADTSTTGNRLFNIQATYSPRAIEFGRTIPAAYFGFRIPVMVQTTNYLLLTTEARIGSVSDSANRDILLWRLWLRNPHIFANNMILMNDGTNAASIINSWTGAASIVQDLNLLYRPGVGSGPNGEVDAFYVRYPNGFNESNAVIGQIGNTATLWTFTSADELFTATAPVNVTTQIKDAAWAGMLPGPDALGLHSGGRIIQTSGYSTSTGIGTLGQVSFYTTDFVTWNTGGILLTAASGVSGGESCWVEVAGGVILAWARTQTSNAMKYYTSNDAANTWVLQATPGNAPQNPVCSIDMVVGDKRPGRAVNKDWLIQSFPNHASSRQDGCITMSPDGGANWCGVAAPTQNVAGGTRYSSGGFGYSALSILADGTVALYFEHGDANGSLNSFTLAFLDRSWLGGPFPYMQDDLNAGFMNPQGMM